jgi:hypothetical protein
MVAYPIITLADGVVTDPQWFADVTDAANDHQTRLSNLEGVTREPIWTIFSTSDSAGGTGTETVFATGPSSTYKAHTAYRIEISGYAVRTAGASTVLNVKIRDTNNAGTQRMFDSNYTVSASELPLQFFHYVANTTANDILGRVLVGTLVTQAASTVVLRGHATKPWYMTCIEVGTDTDFPQSVAL